MALSATLEITGDTAKITLTGELDASSAGIFKAEVENAAGTPGVKRLVLFIQDLEYIASAGLRVLITAKQKMGTDADIYIVGGQEQVLETLEKTGFDQSVIIQDTYEVA
ncbi:anti-sigma factor antagonist [Calothrix sp. FACHB-1219]|uniref:anti-sigma factor antagonist n=1 Tax=unclassified Calothrix TaxID=2619626 RepID=UPI001686579A|nr:MULTISPECIES: anti-sigma factor antagonist [unclassified Calothrix]MBD2203570.1 anti-sigma factor antagonist [Calothrix sp. FACHB-168]MBD2221181.1 anti-sigma factor antagonist [Calothrix sp. FACHB-1219]